MEQEGGKVKKRQRHKEILRARGRENNKRYRDRKHT